jgi:gamma-glutamyltranspeptidase/glutathione hydrolase
VHSKPPAPVRPAQVDTTDVGTAEVGPVPARLSPGRVRAATLAAFVLLATPAAAVSPQPVEGEHGMVVSDQRLASEVGAAMLRAGGNAVDAAVAVGYAQAVVNPCCGNLGGGGFMTIRLAGGELIFVDFREAAPGRATADMYLDDKGEVIPRASLDGWKAVGVPASVLGLDAVLAKWGTKDRATVMAPAIRLAREGFALTRGDTDILAAGTKAFQANPVLGAIFLDAGKPFAPGAKLVQADLAATLEGIAKDGPDYFYKGPVAEAIVAASEAGGGLLSKQDFADYAVRFGETIECRYRGYEVRSAAPPSSGGIALCEILHVLEGYPMGWLGHNSADAVHLMTEAFRHAFVDRNFLLGDPDFGPNPVERLVSDDYAALIRAAIDRRRGGPLGGHPARGGAAREHRDDALLGGRQGRQRGLRHLYHQFLFGAKVIAGDTGFFLNNEMDDFTTRPGTANMFGLVQGEKNAIAPGKRPLSSMSPTIVTRDGELFMVTGSPGGPRIITTTLATIMNVVDFGMNAKEAVNAPRIHHQWLPDQIFVEPMALSADTRKLLTERGHTVVVQNPWGAVEAILVGGGEPKAGEAASFGDDVLRGRPVVEGWTYGANDNRRPAGAAVGE